MRASAAERPEVKLHVVLSALVMSLEGGCSRLQEAALQIRQQASPSNGQLFHSGSEQFPSKFPQMGNYFSEDAWSADGVP